MAQKRQFATSFDKSHQSSAQHGNEADQPPTVALESVAAGIEHTFTEADQFTVALSGQAGQRSDDGSQGNKEPVAWEAGGN